MLLFLKIIFIVNNKYRAKMKKEKQTKSYNYVNITLSNNSINKRKSQTNPDGLGNNLPVNPHSYFNTKKKNAMMSR